MTCIREVLRAKFADLEFVKKLIVALSRAGSNFGEAESSSSSAEKKKPLVLTANLAGVTRGSATSVAVGAFGCGLEVSTIGDQLSLFSFFYLTHLCQIHV